MENILSERWIWRIRRRDIFEDLPKQIMKMSRGE
jgi:hypothetical protein